MNRRLFLTGTGAAATAYSAYHWVKPQRAYAQASGALDYDIVSAATTNHTTTVANCYNGVANGDDWRNLQMIHSYMRADIGSKGLDDNFKQSMQSVSNVDLSTVDLQQVTSAVQVYQPAFQFADAQAYYNLLPKDPGTLAGVVSGLQQSGIIELINEHMNRCAAMASFCDYVNGNQGGNGGPTAMTKRKGPTRNIFYVDPPPNPAGYNCAIDGAASLGLGIAMAVIFVMAGPAAVLAMAFWEGLAAWGGLAATAWGAGHVVFCGF